MRVRPLLKAENALKAGKKSTDIMRVMDGKVVVVLDPDESKVWEERGRRGESSAMQFEPCTSSRMAA